MDLNSEKIKRLITKNDNLNLIVTKPHKFFKEYMKSDVYNKDIDEPLHKIWLKTPKIKVLHNTSFNNTLNKDIGLGLAPMTNEIKKFIEIISKIESHVSKVLEINHKSSLKKINDYMTIFNIKTPIVNNKFNFKCYEPDNKIMDFKDIRKGDKLSAFIELKDVWIKNDELGFNWTILQAKTYKVFDFSKCLFDDECSVPIETNVTPPPPPPLNNFLTNYNSEYSKINNDNKQITKNNFIPTKEDLLNMKNKLKKTNNSNNKINKYEEHIDINSFLLNAELDQTTFQDEQKKINKKYKKILRSF